MRFSRAGIQETDYLQLWLKLAVGSNTGHGLPSSSLLLITNGPSTRQDFTGTIGGQNTRKRNKGNDTDHHEDDNDDDDSNDENYPKNDSNGLKTIQKTTQNNSKMVGECETKNSKNDPKSSTNSFKIHVLITWSYNTMTRWHDASYESYDSYESSGSHESCKSWILRILWILWIR